MCLTCCIGNEHYSPIREPKGFFIWKDKKNKTHFTECLIHTPNGDVYKSTPKFLQEVMENAVAVVTTGVDGVLDIWSIQWKRDYKIKHFPSAKNRIVLKNIFKEKQ